MKRNLNIIINKKSLKLLSVVVFSLVIAVSQLLFAPVTFATKHVLCEANVFEYCADTNGFLISDPVFQQTTGPNVDFVADGGSYHNHPTGVLKFTGANNRCISYDDIVKIADVSQCSGVNNIIWAQDTSQSSGIEYINRDETQDHGGSHDYVLSADGIGNHNVTVVQDGTTGYLQLWYFCTGGGNC